MFENLIVITLEHRLDRQQYIKNYLNSLNLKYNFFYGINGQESNYQGPLLKGEFGIRQTHLNLLKFALARNYESIFIIEDDVVFDESFQFKLNNIQIPHNFDLLYLGGSHKEQPLYISDNIYKVYNTLCLHAVIIKNTIFQKLIDVIQNQPNIQVDNAYALLQPSINAYVIYPHLAWQKDDYSDIQNKFVKYDWLKPQ